MIKLPHYVMQPHYVTTRIVERLLLAAPSPSRRARSILVACFMKSGSTYLTKLLANISGYRHTTFASSEQYAAANEQDLYHIKLGQCRRMNTVIHQHVKGTRNNVHLMKRYSMKPVILVRNIYDIIPSIRDHFARESQVGPTGYVHREYFEMSEEEQLLYIARVHTPWCFNFLVSWREASEELDTFWTSYEELFGDQVGTVSRLLEFQGLSMDTARVEAGIAAMGGENTRRNVGVSGRGELLPDQCKQAVLDIAESWKLDDDTMARIGL